MVQLKKKSHEGIAEKFRKGREKTVTAEKIKLLLLLFLCIPKAKNKAFFRKQLVKYWPAIPAGHFNNSGAQLIHF